MTIPTYGKLDIGEGLASLGMNIMRMIKPDFEQAAAISDQIKANPQVAQQFADALYLGNPLPPMHREAFQLIQGLSPSTSARVEKVHRAALSSDALSNPDLANIAPEDIETMRDIQLFGAPSYGAQQRRAAAEEATRQRADAAGNRLQLGRDRLVEAQYEFDQREHRLNRGLDALINYRNASLAQQRSIAAAARNMQRELAGKRDNNVNENEAFKIFTTSNGRITLEQARDFVNGTGADPTGEVGAAMVASHANQAMGTIRGLRGQIGSYVRMLNSTTQNDTAKQFAVTQINSLLQEVNQAYKDAGLEPPTGDNVHVETNQRFLRGEQIFVTDGTKRLNLDDVYDISRQFDDTPPAATPPAAGGTTTPPASTTPPSTTPVAPAPAPARPRATTPRTVTPRNAPAAAPRTAAPAKTAAEVTAHKTAYRNTIPARLISTNRARLISNGFTPTQADDILSTAVKPEPPPR